RRAQSQRDAAQRRVSSLQGGTRAELRRAAAPADRRGDCRAREPRADEHAGAHDRRPRRRAGGDPRVLEPHRRVQYRRSPEVEAVEETPPPPPMRWVPERFYDRLPTGPKRFVRKALALGWRVGVTDVGSTNLVVRAQ